MYVQHNSPFTKKGDAPSRKKSKGYYAEVKKGKGKGKDAGGGMTEKGVKKSWQQTINCCNYAAIKA